MLRLCQHRLLLESSNDVNLGLLPVLILRPIIATLRIFYRDPGYQSHKGENATPDTLAVMAAIAATTQEYGQAAWTGEANLMTMTVSANIPAPPRSRPSGHQISTIWMTMIPSAAMLGRRARERI